MSRLVGAYALLIALSTAIFAAEPQPGMQARYYLLPGAGGQSNLRPLTVTFLYGPQGQWQMTLYEKAAGEGEPMMQLRARTTVDPLAGLPERMQFLTYRLHIPSTGETYEYRDANHPELALLPAWQDFRLLFLPQPARGTRRTDGFPNTCRFLGQVLSLREVAHDVEWKPWPDVKVLELDNELWIATSRTVKDQEGHRLAQEPERRNYNYVPWSLDDYKELIDAGMNVFSLNPGKEEFVRSQPVFYRRGYQGDQPLNWPADFYRSNFIGPVLYMDEPSCRLTGNEQFHPYSYWFTDATAAICSRVEAEVPQKRYDLHHQLASHGIPLGSMKVGQAHFVTWDTRYESAYYQFLAGAPAFVHEGRYQLGEFNEFARATTGLNRVHTAEEMLRYVYAVMRGPARRFGGDWGTAIYGQADPALSPLAVKLAYDMGARYIWYWTSDHGHHLPYNEQLELSRIVRSHAKEHPRASIHDTYPVRDKLLLIPYGYLPTLESANRKNCWDLWWIREMDAEKKNEASQRYARMMRNLFTEVHNCFDAGEDFDISIDDGSQPRGYRKIVRISDR